MPGGFFSLNQINLTNSKSYSWKNQSFIFLEREKSIFNHAFGGNEQDDKGKQQEIENRLGFEQVEFSEGQDEGANTFHKKIHFRLYR